MQFCAHVFRSLSVPIFRYSSSFGTSDLSWVLSSLGQLGEWQAWQGQAGLAGAAAPMVGDDQPGLGFVSTPQMSSEVGLWLVGLLKPEMDQGMLISHLSQFRSPAAGRGRSWRQCPGRRMSVPQPARGCLLAETGGRNGRVRRHSGQSSGGRWYI